MLEYNKSEKDILLEYTLEKIKGKNDQFKEQFINDYIPFIVKVVSKLSNRYIDIKSSDEFSIGLSAFNEAIDCYDKRKHRSFIRFAEQVIKRRMIDYIRVNKKNQKIYPFTYFDVEDSYGFEHSYLKEDNAFRYENIETKQEIELFEQNLKSFGITLEELTLCSPKHKDSKLLSIEIAKMLCKEDKLFDKLYKKKKIPAEELMKVINVSKRTLERNRKFIIAVCLILKSNLTVLKGYVDNSVIEEEKFE